MTGTEMALMLHIQAKNQDAIAKINATSEALKRSAQQHAEWAKKVGEQWDRISSRNVMPERLSKLGENAHNAFSKIGSAANMFFRPLEYLSKAVGLAGGALVGMGAAALHAADEDAALIARLEMAGYSAEGARKEFEKLEKVSRNTSFKTDDLAEATMYLKQFGLAGDKNLATVANAAKFAGSNVADMAVQIGTLQARGLKKFGIDLEAKDDGFILSWTDKFGQFQKLVTKNKEEAKRAMMDVIGGKFGMTIKAPTTLGGSLAALKNGVEQMFANVGEPMLAAATKFVNWIRTGMEKLFSSGKLTELGAMLGKWIDKAHIWVRDFASGVGNFIDVIKRAQEKGNLTQLWQTVMAGAGRVLSTAFMAAIQASIGIWKFIGSVLAASIGEQILQMPGMGGIRDRKVLNTVNALEAQGRISEVDKVVPGFSKKVSEVAARWGGNREMGIDSAVGSLTPEQQAQVGTMIDYGALEKAISTFKSDMSTSGQMILDGIKQTVADVDKFAAGNGQDMEQRRKMDHMLNVEAVMGEGRKRAREVLAGEDNGAPSDLRQGSGSTYTQGSNLRRIQEGRSGMEKGKYDVAIRVVNDPHVSEYRIEQAKIDSPTVSAAGL